MNEPNVSLVMHSFLANVIFSPITSVTQLLQVCSYTHYFCIELHRNVREHFSCRTVCFKVVWLCGLYLLNLICSLKLCKVLIYQWTSVTVLRKLCRPHIRECCGLLNTALPLFTSLHPLLPHSFLHFTYHPPSDRRTKTYASRVGALLVAKLPQNLC